MSLTDREVQQRVARVESLLERLESLPDAAARDAALATVEALVDMYGEGLARIVEHVGCSGDPSLATAFAGDELVSHLLMLHGLHPEDVETRVQRALDGVRPYLKSHGGNVELISVERGVARLRLEGSCRGCPSSAATLRLTVEDAVRAAAPEIERIDADGVEPPAPAPALVSLSHVRRAEVGALVGTLVGTLAGSAAP